MEDADTDRTADQGRDRAGDQPPDATEDSGQRPADGDEDQARLQGLLVRPDLRRDGTVWTTDKDGILLDLLACEIRAVTGRDLGDLYEDLVARFGRPVYERIDAPADRDQKAALQRLSPESVTASDLAGESPGTGYGLVWSLPEARAAELMAADDAAFEHVFGHEVDEATKSLWDFSREMTARITWKPYMFSRRLGPVRAGRRVKAEGVKGRRAKVSRRSGGGARTPARGAPARRPAGHPRPPLRPPGRTGPRDIGCRVHRIGPDLGWRDAAP